MKLARIIGLCLIALSTGAQAQGWSEAYDNALAEARLNKWAEARAFFQQAVSLRTEDVAGPTTLPGSVTEPRRWRDGKPYSPNFGAAYSAYRSAPLAADDAARSAAFRQAADEFWALLNKGQVAKETVFFLAVSLAHLRDVEGQKRLDEFVTKNGGRFNWKVDTDFVDPAEIASMNEQLARATSPPPSTGGPPATGTPPSVISNPPATGGTPAVLPSTFGGAVPPVPTKYALIIGQSSGKLAGHVLPFAGADALAIREALVLYAGYPESNVDVVINGTAEQIAASAKALADRMPEDATLLIYYSGGGVNLDGKDYLAGIETESPTDTSTMIAKMDLYRPFITKGARIFGFFEANRPIEKGRYFGMEIPMFGLISQMQATMPGHVVQPVTRAGKEVGVFADAFMGVLSEFKSNRVPITEFAWQLFNRMRRGNTGSEGGGSRQTPTLPVLSNMASNATF